MTSKQNNKDYIVGMYVRLSRDDERTGESLSIENQKAILNEYIEKQGFTLYDIYVDDGISGTTFDRPGVKRLLDDAKQGVINTVLVKDMSRFGRNYIMVGQYLDYVFPAFGIRFRTTLWSDSISIMCFPLSASGLSPYPTTSTPRTKTPPPWI